MRSAERTPEPFGSPATHRPRLFVVQKHAARALHYDFRLEWGGTLWSWAVPKGPSLDPADKRLAVHVEDHPVEYADFEGVIPEGNYGAGSVIVWDRGLWIPWEDPDEGLAQGKLHFELRGYKLRGVFLLLRTKRGNPKEWLLFKKPDAHSRESGAPGSVPFDEASIFSGLTVDELAAGKTKTAAIRRALKKLEAPAGSVDPKKLKLMLAKTGDGAFTDPGWLFELKYDGYRVVAARDETGTPYLRSRNGVDYTKLFPEITLALRGLPYPNLVLDGEMVTLDENSRPDFHRLQKRARLRRARDVDRATVELPVHYFAFDLLQFGEYDLRSLPLVERKKILKKILPASGPVRFSDHVMKRGKDMYAAAQQMRLEGIMAKKASSPYLGRRSAHWLKLTVDRTGDFVVCGFTAPKGSRTGLGALHLGIYQGDTLVYAGRVGTGMDDRMLSELREMLEPDRRDDPPCEGDVPRGANHFWVEPELVVEVQYKTVSHGGLLRAPVFLRVRDDKAPADCVRDTPPPPPDDEEPPEMAPVEEPPREVTLTNLDKVFWPEEKYTKGDLIEYYRAVSPWLLPYLKDRPLVLTRYPDGIEGKSFYQKNVPDFIPDWIRTESVWSEHAGRDIRYLVCDDLDTLLYVINMGSIPLHLWSSRAGNLPHPDWCIMDFDPKGAPFKDVLTLAKAVGALCEEIGLPAYPKTSGSTGLHVLIPLGAQCTYEQSRLLGQLIAHVVHHRHPKISTVARATRARKGRVYLDYLQNRHGQLLVAPYCVRPLPGAPVSAPLEWKEVNGRLHPQKYTMANLLRRLKRKPVDPLLPILTETPDLVGALARLSELVD